MPESDAPLQIGGNVMARKKNRKFKFKHPKSPPKKPPRKFPIKRNPPVPQTLKQYLSLSHKDQETLDSVGQIISRVRAGYRLTPVLAEYGISRKIFIARGRPALRKKNGKYVATKTDKLLRVVSGLTGKGKELIATRDSRQASLIGGHWAAVQRYLQTGDDSPLLRFKGWKVTDASGKRHSLLTDLKKLDRLASAGVLSFESIYAGAH
jgi:hypothetical protein